MSMTRPPEMEPCDVLISRISRELSRRLLSVQRVSEVRHRAQGASPGFNLRAQRRYKSGLAVTGHIQRSRAQKLDGYIQSHLTLMIAYSKAGSTPIPNTECAEQRESDATDFVEVPLCTLMRYHHRLQDRARKLNPAAALSWIRDKDESERSAWAIQHRNSTESLGKIIAATTRDRAAMWELPPHPEQRNAKQVKKRQSSAEGPPRGEHQ